MGAKAKEAIVAAEVTIVADRGYYNGEEVLACEGHGHPACHAAGRHVGPRQEGPLFVRADFTYDPVADHYVCPAGAMLTKAKVVRTGTATSTITAISMLPCLRDAGALHAREGEADEAMAARGRAGGHAEATRRDAERHGGPPGTWSTSSVR